MKYERIICGTFIERPNRFIAMVDIAGTIEKCHVKNTGRCREILLKGTEVYLQKGTSPGRSTPYDLIAARKRDFIINIDSQAPNKVALESIERILGPCDTVKPEFTLGESRFDFYAEQGGRKVLMEVKGVTKESDYRVCFPDAPTERGLKHVREHVPNKIRVPGCSYCRILDKWDEPGYTREGGEYLMHHAHDEVCEPPTSGHGEGGGTHYAH